MARLTLSLSAVTLILLPDAMAGSRQRADQPDSLRSVLELSLERANLVELSGSMVGEVRLYTSADRSRIAWWKDKTLYVYSLTGQDHALRAATLMTLMQQGNLATFVVERRASRMEGFVHVARVEALQIVSSVTRGR